MVIKEERHELISSFEKSTRFLKKKRSGGNGEVETPVPIPNTEVKHLSGEGI